MSYLNLDVLRILQITIVILGIVIVYFAGKGYKKTKSKSLLFLALGFLLVTIGAVAAGLLFEFLDFDIYTVEAVSAASEVLGFILIIYSIVWAKN
ncbi:MAG: DUF7521 family protein [Nitrososphaerales archaeon]